MAEKQHPLAIPAPEGAWVPLTAGMVDEAVRASRESPRGRIIQRLHLDDHDPLQRMFNVLQPGSYIPPHRHLDPPKAETIAVLRGAIGYLGFDEGGRVTASARLAAGEPAFGVDVRPGAFHTFFALEPDTVVLEVKPGPYSRATDKDFASWAPAEGDPGAAGYLQNLEGYFA